VLINDQKVKVKWGTRNKKHYTSFDYIFTKIGDEFEVRIEHLQNGCSSYVKVYCDICKEIYLKSYRNHVQYGSDICANCIGKDKSHSYFYIQSFFKKNGCKLLTKEYINNTQDLKFICKCGQESTTKFCNFRETKRCLKCCGQYVPTFDEVYDYFLSQNCLLLEGKYVNARTQMSYICSCGNKSKIQYMHFQKGVRCKECGLKKSANSRKGKPRPHWRGINSPHWKENLTEEERNKGRRAFHSDIKLWREKVYQRDNFTCQCCGDNKGGNLNAHHLNSWNWAINERFKLDNGISLCDECHAGFHNQYGYGDNTKEQFEQFKQRYHS
jgi:hypothetical protein